MTLYDDAYNEFANRQNSLLITWSGNNYNPINFLADPVFNSQYDSAYSEQAANTRAIIISGASQTTVITNQDVKDIYLLAVNAYQKLLDGYQAILVQIGNGTITMTSQISSNWNIFNAAYVNHRVEMPSIETIYNSLTTLQTTVSGFSSSVVQADWTQNTSSNPSYIKNKPTIPAAQVQVDWTQASTGAVDYIKNKPAARSQSPASRSLNSGFQISTTRDSLVNYSVDVSATLSLVTGQVGTVFLEIASDSGFTTNLQELGRFVNGNSGTLTIGLNLTQNVTGTLSGFVPSGYYARLRTANTTGTPTFTYRSGQEVLL